MGRFYAEIQEFISLSIVQRYPISNLHSSQVVTTGAEHRSRLLPLMLLLAQVLIDCSTNGAALGELLSDRSIATERTSDLLAYATDRSVRCDIC